MLEIIASLGDSVVVWFEYDGDSSIIEKPLHLSHIFKGDDDDWIQDKVTADMGLTEIAENVKAIQDETPIPWSCEESKADLIPKNKMYKCTHCGERKIHEHYKHACGNKECPTNN